jgi:hypothetical protein
MPCPQAPPEGIAGRQLGPGDGHARQCSAPRTFVRLGYLRFTAQFS